MTRQQADAGLVLVTVVWGVSFSAVHEAMRFYPPLSFLALRFAVASLALAPLLILRRREVRRSVGAGLALGALLFGGFATQTAGLTHTTPARAGFITGLSVVLVPMIAFSFGQKPARRALVGAVLAVAGLAVVSFGCRLSQLGCSAEPAAGPERLRGDALVLACAVLFALHMVGVGRFTAKLPPSTLNGVQLLVVALLSGLTGVAFERPLSAPAPAVAGIAAFLGFVSTALAFAVWLRLQPHTTSTHTALIFSLEPVFAALFSWWWTGETITPAIWLGGGLMLAGVLLAELPLARSAETRGLLRWLSDDPVPGPAGSGPRAELGDPIAR